VPSLTRPRNTRPITVASIPAAHPYVRGLSRAGDAVLRLPDPVPRDATVAGQWWPPVMLDAAWIGEHADRFDVMHLHFGVESFSLQHLRSATAALRDARKPLVFTVHDLANPQLRDQADHLDQLGLLVAEADELITLTAGAAAEIRMRWGRTATVIAHPNVFPLAQTAPMPRSTGERIVFGTHLRDLRPNIDGVGATEAMLLAVARLHAEGIDSEARVFLNENVRDRTARDAIRALVRSHPHAALIEQPRPDDDELARSLAELDVAVLPYAYGTHSGWVELCYDLGVEVAGSGVGFIAEQHADHHFAYALSDGASLARAVRAAADAGERPGSTGRGALVRARKTERAEQRAQIAEAHREVYLRAIGAMA
jgi:hypothetical protein